MSKKLFSKFYPILLRTPLHKTILEKYSSENIVKKFSDGWGGNADNGYELLKGYFSFYGESVFLENYVWAKNKASLTWNNELHSFCWIRDLRAVGSNKARTFARKCVTDWIKEFNYWSKKEWRSDILAKRVCVLLENFTFYCSGAEEKVQKKVIKSLSIQSKHLVNYNLVDTDGFERMFCVKAIIMASLSFKTLKKFQNFGCSLVLSEIDKQVTDEGLHKQKSPKIHLEFLQVLIDIKNFLSLSKIKVPEKVNSTILKMASFLKFYRHGDGSLASFNNSPPVSKLLIDQVLLRSNSKIKIPNSSNKLGLQRISENKITFLMDAGKPSTYSTYAGSLSFEFSFGKQIVIVNSGSPHIQNKKWAEAMKSTAAHSTLTIDNVNSSDIFFEKFKKGRIADVWSKKYTDGKSHWVESSHNGYKEVFGLIHNRKIHIDTYRKIIRGQDTLVKTPDYYKTKPKFAQIRFHIHPNVEANITSGKKKVILRLKDGHGWEFICSDPIIEIGESIYLGLSNAIARNSHILLEEKVIPGKKLKWLFRSIS